MQPEEHKRLKILFKKYKTAMKTKKNIVNVVEPVLLLMRRDNSVEFLEDVDTTPFTFRHSDRTYRKVELPPSLIQKFPYGNSEFKGYILHEDCAFPYPQDPIIHAELMQMGYDKIISDEKSWKTKELGAWTKLIFTIGAILVVALLLIFAFKGDDKQIVINLAQNVSSNFSGAIPI